LRDGVGGPAAAPELCEREKVNQSDEDSDHHVLGYPEEVSDFDRNLVDAAEELPIFCDRLVIRDFNSLLILTQLVVDVELLLGHFTSVDGA